MSRIGRMPIAIPAGVTVEIAENNKVTVKGPKGTLERVLPAEMEIKQEGEEILVNRPNDLKKMRSLHGLTRTLIHNLSLIHISEPTRRTPISYAVFCLKKKKKHDLVSRLRINKKKNKKYT